MSEHNDLLSQLPDMISALNDGKRIQFETHGFSMVPLLHDGGDSVILEKADERLKIGDVALCKTSEGKYVLHRVLGLQGDGYILKGDNCITTERCLSHCDVVGVACAFIRNGKTVFCTDRRYLFYVRNRKIFLAIWRFFWKIADFFVKLFRR